MALEDKDIFRAICDRNPGQPIEFIMQQYEVARQINKEIEKRDEMEKEAVPETTVLEAAMECEAEAQPPKKKYSRRQFKVKPQAAISEDAIYCCICGAQRQSLTSTHLLAHDLTVEEYKKLCGYSENQPLMSGKRLKKSKEIIARAQQARMKKSAEKRMD